MSRRFDIPCRLDIACDADDVFAHVDLMGVKLGPADRVRVHDAPAHIRFGERRTVSTRATVTRATAIERMWTKMLQRLRLSDLYEVSFSPGRAP